MKRMFFAVFMTAAMIIGSGGIFTFADAETISGDTQINAYNYGDQANPAIAMAPDGGFIIAWTSKGQDGDGHGIYGLRHDNSGNAVGPEFEVNTSTTGNQYDPAAAMDANGRFVITWSGHGREDDRWGVYGQTYNSYGNRVGTEFKVNTYTEDIQFQPSVAMGSDGGFVVTWSSGGQDGSSWGVYGQRYNIAGHAVGPEFKVNSFTTGYQSNPSTAVDANGNLVIAWTSKDQDGDGYGLFMKKYP